MKKSNDLLFYNGYGGFDTANSEYVIFGEPDKSTPSPWCNIIANPNFGFLTTETGNSFSWYENSSLFRLTPKISDPVSGNSEEKLFIKDEKTGQVWGGTENIAGTEISYITRHGKGYSNFTHEENGIMSTITYFVDRKLPVKYIMVDFVNTTREERKISATYYARPVLGDFAENTRGKLEERLDVRHGFISFTNPYSDIFPEALFFLASSGTSVALANNRTEFWGRDYAGGIPAALARKKFPSLKPDPNDPAMIVKTEVELPPTSSKRCVFYLSVTQGDHIHKMLSDVKSASHVQNEYDAVKRYWKHLGSSIEITTPDSALDTIFNDQLLYQLVSSRVWAKTGFSQPGGAFGFRDQLQDMLALLWAEPKSARKHILLCASRQFLAGDVQHWWHPPKGNGIRSASSDTALWLVYVACTYVRITGDAGIWDEIVPYLKSQKAEHGPHDYFIPEKSDDSATLYEHCIAAIERTTYLSGKHGLPLMLSGDWNDSLSGVGNEKKGESVWMGMFLARILNDFAPVCLTHKDKDRSIRYRKFSAKLGHILTADCWDGEWFLRAFWDDGEKLGTHTDSVCRIDAIVQNWAVISGVIDAAKAKRAMSSVEKNLLDRANGLVKLLTEPFDENYPKDPGYILTYPPGTRENGGAYSHASGWTAQAFAMLGDGDLAMEALSMINPISHSNERKRAEKYGGEPYVLAGDIYAGKGYEGRSGWTWYTGAAGVYYVTVVEHVFGFKKEGEKVTISPCVPKSWREFSLDFRYGKTKYRIEYANPNGVSTGIKHLLVGGRVTEKTTIELADDGKTHLIQVVMG